MIMGRETGLNKWKVHGNDSENNERLWAMTFLSLGRGISGRSLGREMRKVLSFGGN